MFTKPATVTPETHTWVRTDHYASFASSPQLRHSAKHMSPFPARYKSLLDAGRRTRNLLCPRSCPHSSVAVTLLCQRQDKLVEFPVFAWLHQHCKFSRGRLPLYHDHGAWQKNIIDPTCQVPCSQSRKPAYASEARDGQCNGRWARPDRAGWGSDITQVGIMGLINGWQLTGKSPALPCV
jgi:hypothetical protein